MICPSKRMVQFFREEYRDKFDKDYYPTWGCDMKIMTELLKEVDKERLETLIKYFLAGKHKSYGIRWFKVVFNDVVRLFREEKTPKKMVNPDANRF